jgi:hypothetical protein
MNHTSNLRYILFFRKNSCVLCVLCLGIYFPISRALAEGMSWRGHACPVTDYLPGPHAEQPHGKAQVGALTYEKMTSSSSNLFGVIFIECTANLRGFVKESFFRKKSCVGAAR